MSGQIIIKKPGISSIQHIARWNYRKYGVPVGGPLDIYNAARANQLLAVPIDTPVVEVFFKVFECVVNCSLKVAASGAAKNIIINGSIHSCENVHFLSPGDHLCISDTDHGFITYLAFSKELRFESKLGSMGSLMPFFTENPGKVQPNFRWLKVNDNLEVGGCVESSQRGKDPLPKWYIPKSVKIRFVAGPEYQLVEDASKATLEQEAFCITNEVNRMGYRIKGTRVTTKSQVSLSSRVTLPGMVQLTPNGELLLLQADAQTTGGYPRIMQICLHDLHMLAQAGPGKKIRFKKIDYREAKRLALKEDYFFSFLPDSY